MALLISCETYPRRDPAPASPLRVPASPAAPAAPHSPAAVAAPVRVPEPEWEARTAPASPVRVLFLGDSLSIGEFGRTFDRKLRDAGFEVYTSVAGGGTPYYWLSEYPPVSIDIAYWERTPASERRLPGISPVPKLEPLLAKWKPDVVVVQTGTNLYAPLRSKKRSKAENTREIESLIEKMCRAVSANGRRQCYWITPPAAHTERYPKALQDQMFEIMRHVAGRYGPVFNSRQVTTYTEPYPQSDGIHPGSTAARKWAEKVARDFITRFRPNSGRSLPSN